ncbi:hypothetical protein E6Q11_01130, partial [Candidatus Dojkabacteria bacterium]
MNQGESGAESAVNVSDNYVEESNEAVTPAEAEAPPAEPAKEDEAGQDDKGSSEQKPRRGGFQRKLERQQREIEALKALVAKATAPGQSDNAQGGEPALENYQDYNDYVRDYAKWASKETTK